MKKILLPIITLMAFVAINAQTIDATFGTQNGFTIIDWDQVQNPPVPSNYSEQAYDVSLQDDGKILVTGRLFDAGYFLSRHNTDGLLDSTFEQFNTGLVRRLDASSDANSARYGSWAIKQASNGGYYTLSKGHTDVVGSGTWQEPLRIHKFDANNAASLDANFGSSGSASTQLYDPFPGVYRNEPRSLVELDNGKLLAAGYTYNAVAPTTAFGFIVKFNTDGTLDNTFGGGDGKAENLGLMNAVFAMAVQDNGKIILVGTEPNGACISRYLSSGELDTTFNYQGQSYGGFALFYGNSDLRDIIIDNNDEYVMVGKDEDAQINKGFIVRIDSNAYSTGINTTSYYTHTTLPTTIYTNTLLNKVHQLANGKYVATGLTQVISDNTYRTIIAQFNNDLSVDSTFGTNGYEIVDLNTTQPNSNYSNGSVVDNNGDLIICGTFVTGATTTDYYLAKYSLAPSSVSVSSITVQGQNGVSSITTNGGTLQMEADVLPANADDMTYTWSVTNGTGSATIDANGLLTATTNGIVTVTATANDGSGVSGSADITISNQGAAIDNVAFENLSIYPNPATNYVTVETGNEKITSIRLLDIMGKTVKIFNPADQKLNVSNINKGIYLLELANAEKHSVVKLVLQ